jgi:MFS family permease
MGYPTVSYFLERKSMDGRERNLRRNRRIRRIEPSILLAFAQFVIIAVLLSAASAEYQSNAYMQEWIARNASPIGYLLNGYLAATLVGFAIGGALLLFQRWRSPEKAR